MRTGGIPDRDRPRSASTKPILPAPGIFSVAEIDSLLAADAGRTTGERVGLWARRFWPPRDRLPLRSAAGGYVDLGRIVLDDRHDCVSLVYRCTELASSGSAAEAVDRALSTRFAGADLDSLADAKDGSTTIGPNTWTSASTWSAAAGGAGTSPPT